MSRLHRRLAALLGFIALATFVSGAGFDAPAVIPAAIVLLVAVFVQPGERVTRMLDPLWRAAALLLAARAVWRVLGGGIDPVLPMVDLLLLLLCAESLRQRDGGGDARHFALTFALLIASAAYRPGPLFGLLFVAYVVCATLALVVGHLSRQAALRTLAPPAPQPRFLVRVAGLSSVVIAVSVIVFMFFPRVSQGWAARGTPIVSRAVVGFSDRVSLAEHGARIESNPEVVLRIEFPGGVPPDVTSLHWRGRSYNRFDGVTWSRDQRAVAITREAASWRGPLIDQVVYQVPLGDANILFGLHPVLDMGGISRIRPFRAASGDFHYYGDADPVYRVRSRAALPAADSLRMARTDDYTPGLIVHLQLPPISQRMFALADSFRRASPNPYDHARNVEQWLHTQFAYTLELPATRREATLDHFLFERRAGHCEYFSTAMAILLRAGGVPTRNVNGFLGGTWNEFGQILTVTQNNAHSWVEVYFEGYGWVPFDPTPASGTAATGVGVRRRSALRLFAEGLDHRWSKWILDYDIGKQRSLVERAAAPFTPRARAVDDEGAPRRSFWPIVTIIAAIIAAVVIVGRVLRLRARTPSSAVTRAYLALHRAYTRAGFASPVLIPPLAFASAIADAPGAVHAHRAIDLYLRNRFGGMEVDAEEVRKAVAAAKAALRQQRRMSH